MLLDIINPFQINVAVLHPLKASENSEIPFFSGSIGGALCDLVPSVQPKKRKKHPLRSVTFSKVAG